MTVAWIDFNGIATILETARNAADTSSVVWREIARGLNTPLLEIDSLDDSIRDRGRKPKDIYISLLAGWTSRKSKQATLEQLVEVLKQLEFNAVADELWEKYSKTGPTESEIQTLLSNTTRTSTGKCGCLLVGSLICYVLLLLFCYFIGEKSTYKNSCVGQTRSETLYAYGEYNLLTPVAMFCTTNLEIISKSVDDWPNGLLIQGFDSVKSFKLKGALPFSILQSILKNGQNLESLEIHDCVDIGKFHDPKISCVLPRLKQVTFSNFTKCEKTVATLFNSQCKFSLKELKFQSGAFTDKIFDSVWNFIRKCNDSIDYLELDGRYSPNNKTLTSEQYSYQVRYFKYNLEISGSDSASFHSPCLSFKKIETFESNLELEYRQLLNILKCPFIVNATATAILNDAKEMYDLSQILQGPTTYKYLKLFLIFRTMPCPKEDRKKRLGIEKIKSEVADVTIISNCFCNLNEKFCYL